MKYFQLLSGPKLLVTKKTTWALLFQITMKIPDVKSAKLLSIMIFSTVDTDLKNADLKLWWPSFVLLRSQKIYLNKWKPSFFWLDELDIERKSPAKTLLCKNSGWRRYFKRMSEWKQTRVIDENSYNNQAEKKEETQLVKS